ncbi:alpha/beta fold hydrolase [Halohasta salina]|uniref:alpha/beta fold hydrolase n=1 Tax=Halohasta salina TaxID=2961621 RepID=UPI0020A2B31A|nr:alpha/beta hydrolase [Halohasta salina]
MSTPATGHLLDSFPYVRVGDGDKRLVMIPGFGDSMFGGRYPPAAAWALQAYFHRFTDACTVYVISRPRGLPANYQIDDAADQYGRILDGFPTPVDVLGISMGGFIGQELAARYPELVEQLVLTVSGWQVAESGRPIIERWQRYADQQRWYQLQSEAAAELYSVRDWRRYLLGSVFGLASQSLLPRPAVSTDVSRSLSAILDYDATDILGEVDAETYVVGGSHDPFFPESILRETADRIPTADVFPIDGAKHGAFDERKRRHDTAVKAFLDGSQPVGAD